MNAPSDGWDLGKAGPDRPEPGMVGAGAPPPTGSPYGAAAPSGQPGYPPQYGQPGYPPQYGQPGYPPQYGQPGPPMPYPVPTRTSGRAIVVLVLGIGSLVGFFVLGAVLGVIALCLAPGAKREIAASNGALTGEGMVLAGKICSWVAIAFTVIGIALFLALFTFSATMTTVPEPVIGSFPS